MRFQKDDTGQWPAFVWPGGYPVSYLMRDGGTLCPPCANSEEQVHVCAGDTCERADYQWCLVDGEENWEDPKLYCDNCGNRIESAYAEED